MVAPSDRKMSRNAQVPPADLDEERITLGRPYRDEVADGPDGETDQPKPQAKADRAGQSAVHNGNASRGAAEQNVLGERAVNRDGEARHLGKLFETGRHYTKAPPPNEKKLRKKELAAKAMLRPKTI